VKVWDAERGQKVVAFKPGPIGAVHGIAYSPDNRRVAIAGETGLVIVWDSETGQELLSLKGHESKVTSLAFSHDGQRLIAGTEQDSVRIWNATTGEQLRVLHGYSSPVAFNADGTLIATGHHDHTLRLLDSESGEERLVLDGHANLVRCAAFSPDGSRLATGSDDQTAKIWSTMTGDQLCELQGHHHIITGVVFSPDGRRVVTSSQDKTAKVWDSEDGQPLFELTGHTSAVSGIAISPDGQRIVTASFDRSVKLWEAHTGLEVLSLPGHKVEVLCVAFSLDGRSIVSGTANPDNTARVWRAANTLPNGIWPLHDPTEQIHYHTEQAEMAERQNRSFAAEVHRRLVARAESELPQMHRMQSLLSNAAQPENDVERQSLVVLLSRRAANYIATEQWELAVVDMKRMVEIQPNQVPSAFDSFRAVERWNEAAHFGRELLEQDPAESLHWVLVAPVMAQSTNEADYIAFCKWIVDQPAETALLADRSIKACLLKPGVVDLAKLPTNALAQALDEGTTPDWFPSYGWACRALQAYRNGNSELAVKYVNQSEAHSPSAVIHALNQATLAMAHLELKNLDAARSALAESWQIISHCRDLPGSTLHPDLMIAQILFREAEVKMKEADASGTADR
jgi:DNA-binding beta-propeller fold protein YncE